MFGFGFFQCRRRHSGGGTPTPTPTPSPSAPVLSNLSSGWAAGDNPPNWDTLYDGIYYDGGTGIGDQLRLIWRVNGGSWTTTAWVPFSISLLVDGWTYPFLTDGSLASGDVFQVKVQPGRDIGLGSESIGPESNIWQDVLGGSSLTALTATIADSWYGINNRPTYEIYGGYYAGAYYAAHPEHSVMNFAKGGTGLEWWDAQRSAIAAARPYALISSFGRNDFMGAAYGGTDDATKLAAYKVAYRQRIDNTKADLPGILIICETLTEQHITANPTFTASYNGNRHAFNDWLVSLKTAGVIAEVIDIGSAPTIGADGAMLPGSAETTDGTHLTEDVGHPAALTVFQSTMNAFYSAHAAPEDDVSDFAITAPSAANEGNSGTTTFAFTVSRTGALTHAATIDYAVTGTGTHPAAASDFVGGVLPSGTVTFASGESSKTLNISVAGDATVENDETFTVTLTNPKTTGTISTATAIGTITNDDAGGTPVGYATVSGLSQEASAGFAGSFTFSNVTVPTGGGRLYFILYSTAGRPAGTFKFTKSGTDYTATQIGSTVSNTQFYYVDLAAGVYTPSMVAASSAFAYVGLAGLLATGVTTQSGAQSLAGGNISNPITFGSSQPVPTSSLGFEFTLTGSAIASRPDGSTQRDTLTINDSFNQTFVVSIGTLPSTATPSVNQTTGVAVEAGFAITANP